MKEEKKQVRVWEETPIAIVNGENQNYKSLSSLQSKQMFGLFLELEA